MIKSYYDGEYDVDILSEMNTFLKSKNSGMKMKINAWRNITVLHKDSFLFEIPIDLIDIENKILEYIDLIEQTNNIETELRFSKINMNEVDKYTYHNDYESLLKNIKIKKDFIHYIRLLYDRKYKISNIIE